MNNQTIYFQIRPILFSVVFSLNGLFQFCMATYRFLYEGYSLLNLTFAIVGLLLMFFGISMHPRLGLIPRVEVTNDVIRLKPGFWSKIVTLDWAFIKEIVFHSYYVEFVLKNGSIHPLDIPQIASVSQDIKKALREKNEEKHIEVKRD